MRRDVKCKNIVHVFLKIHLFTQVDVVHKKHNLGLLSMSIKKTLKIEIIKWLLKDFVPILTNAELP